MERPTCGTCPYWDQSPNFEPNQGYCRRYPAVVTWLPIQQRFEDDLPSPYEDEWCGEHPDFPAYLVQLRSGRAAGASPLPTGDLDRTTIDFSQLSVRVMNILETNGIFTYGQLVKMSRNDLRCLRGLGSYSLHEIKEHLAARGLWLAGHP